MNNFDCMGLINNINNNIDKLIIQIIRFEINLLQEIEKMTHCLDIFQVFNF